MRHPRSFLAALLLAVATAARAGEPRSFTVRFPHFTLPAGSDVEYCYFVRLPATTAFDLGSWRIAHAGVRNTTAPRHFLAYLYTGERLSEFPAGQVIASRGCLDFGPADRDRRVLVATGAARVVAHALPAGVAAELAPVSDTPGGAAAGIGILLDANWSNGDTRARTVSTKLVLRRASSRHALRLARPFSDRSAEAGIMVPPFTEHSTAELVDARWSPATDSCVLGLSGQMHRRGRCIGVDQLGTDGQPKIPASGLANPCEPDRRVQLFVAVDSTDPGAFGFTTPLAVGAGEALRYGCWTDNGARTSPVRLGCEETPGVTPGSLAGGPAPRCSLVVPASSECPGNAACVPANAVPGPSVDDEVCGLTGFVYDAAPGGSCNPGEVQ